MDGYLFHASNGTIDILDGEFNTTGNYGYVLTTNSNGVINVNGGNFNIKGYNTNLIDNYRATINITGGIYTFVNRCDIGKNEGGIFKCENVKLTNLTGALSNEYATAEFNNVEITISGTDCIISNTYNSSAIIKNSKFTTNGTAIYMSNKNNQTIQIENSEITAGYNAIYNTSESGIVIIGKKDGELTENTIITSTSTYPAIYSEGILKFYDGEIRGQTAIKGVVNEIEENSYIDLSYGEITRVVPSWTVT